jgi:hypothetical protein
MSAAISGIFHFFARVPHIAEPVIGRRLAPTRWLMRLTDLPDGRPTAIRVQPLLKKYSDFPKTQISLYVRRPVPLRGALRNVINAGQDAVDADGAPDEGA